MKTFSTSLPLESSKAAASFALNIDHVPMSVEVAPVGSLASPVAGLWRVDHRRPCLTDPFLMGTDYAGRLLSARASVKSFRRRSTPFERFCYSVAHCISHLRVVIPPENKNPAHGRVLFTGQLEGYSENEGCLSGSPRRVA